MIEVYKSTNTNYEKNGDMPLKPLTCMLYVKLNGEIRIELTHSYDAIGRWKYLEEENVIACPTPWGKKQLFRIYKKTKNLTKVTVYASHIMYDLRNKVLLDVRPTSKNGQEALDIILKGTGYTGHSNIKTISTAYYERKNIVAALVGDIDQSFLNRWGGEVLPDNFDIYIYDQVGQNRGVRVQFGKNMTGIEETVDMSSIITRIIPVGYDGIMLDGKKPWVDSDYINSYAQIYESEVKYEDIKLKDGNSEEGYDTLEECREALKAAAKADFEGGADKPVVNYVVDMALLENTAEYKQYKPLETVQIGDEVTCITAKIGIDVEARCISIEYDCIQQKTKKIELGEYVKTYFDQQRETNRAIKKESSSTAKSAAEEIINKNLEGYATKGYVTDSIKSAVVDLVTTEQLNKALEPYDTKLEDQTKSIENVDKKFASYSTTMEMKKAISEATESCAKKEECVTKEEYDEKIQTLEAKLKKLEEKEERKNDSNTN